jgi:transcription elongation factor Elf1
MNRAAARVRGRLAMAQTPENTTVGEDVKDTDIVFDCPKCGKSLAIDYRGAGLTIACSDCGEQVQVPIPEWMEITDLDSSAEEQEVRILNLRRSLAAAEYRIEHLEERIGELSAAKERLDKLRQEDQLRFASLTGHVELMQQTLQETWKILQEIAPSVSVKPSP